MIKKALILIGFLLVPVLNSYADDDIAALLVDSCGVKATIVGGITVNIGDCKP